MTGRKFNIIKRTAAFLLALALLLTSVWSAGCSLSDETPYDGPVMTDITHCGGNEYKGIFDGNEYDFLLCLPERQEDSAPAPLVVMLHGYGNTGEYFRTVTAMDKAGNERGYAIAFLTSPSAEWNSGIGISDKDDVGLIKAFAVGLQQQFNLDSKATFAAGFSNGGFMVQRLAAEASDVFAGVASVAGMMPRAVWQNRPEKTDISVLMVYGTADDVVPMHLNGSAATSPNPAIEDVTEYWASAAGLAEVTTADLSPKAVYTQYTNRAQSRFVGTIVIDGGGHSWTEESISGFNLNEAILDFFDKVGQ
ncbi:MAG: hypothetical protein E7559_09755 [Ruminococcaceae bacterium]|nr:hypothetical protein [Oscillospiraceae bacterium]